MASSLCASPLGLCCDCHGDSGYHSLLCSQPSLQPVRPLPGLILNSIWAVTTTSTPGTQASPRALCQGIGKVIQEPLGLCSPKTRVLETSLKGYNISPWTLPGPQEGQHFYFQPDLPRAQESKAASWAVRQKKVST